MQSAEKLNRHCTEAVIFEINNIDKRAPGSRLNHFSCLSSYNILCKHSFRLITVTQSSRVERPHDILIGHFGTIFLANDLTGAKYPKLSIITPKNNT